jgi:hypothetical protein
MKLTNYTLIASLVFAVITSSAFTASNPSYKLQEEKSFQDYTVRTYFNGENGMGYFEILRKGKRLFKKTGFRFQIGPVYNDDIAKSNLIAIGKDITGDGVPNVVISEWSGGAHCCFYFHVFEIGKNFKKIDSLNAGHGDLSYFADLDNKKGLEFITSDWTFAYWKTSFAQSPAPAIILRFQNGVYVLASDLMRKQAPLTEEIEAKIKEIQSDDAWLNDNVPVSIWSFMLELIYTGNADKAWEFFDKAWPLKISGKKEFLKEFRAQLIKSRYWPQVKKMNERN